MNNLAWHKAVCRDEVLSTNAKALAGALLHFGYSSGAIYPKQPTLQAMTSLSRTALRDAVKEMRDLGWLAVTPGNGRRSTLYGLTLPLEGVVQEPSEGRDVTLRGSLSDPLRVATRPRRTTRDGVDLREKKDSASPVGSATPTAVAEKCGRHLLPLMNDGLCRGCRADRLVLEEDA